MIYSIKSILYDAEITEFRIIKHISFVKTNDVLSDHNSVENELILYTIFFKYESKVYRVDYIGTDVESLTAYIQYVIREKLFYCDEIDLYEKYIDVDNEANVSLPIEEGFIDDWVSVLLNSELGVIGIQYSNTVNIVECLTNTGYSKFSERKLTVACIVEIINGFPPKEIIITNPKGVDDIKEEITTQASLLKKVISKAIPNCPHYSLDMALLSKDVTKTLLSMFCNALQAEQIMFGTSFISTADFNCKIFSKPISIFKQTQYNIDAEGSPCQKKYYVKDGILVAALNDVRSASYLRQSAGDAQFFFQDLCTATSADGIRLLPYCNQDCDNFTVFDTIAGNQLFYNQITGELKMILLSSDTGLCVHIDEHIVEFFNRIQGAYGFNDATDSFADFGLLIDTK